MGASSSEIRAGGAFVEVAADTDKAKKNLTGLGATLDLLKKGLGEESKIGGIFKILSGTGAVAGLAVAARVLSNMTTKAVELSGEFQDGKKSAGDVAEELWQSVPILGDIRKAGLNIRELWDSEAQSIKKMTAEAERMNGVVDARRKILIESNQQWKQQRDIIAGLADDFQLLGKRGLVAQVQGIRNAEAGRERGFRKAAADDIDKLKADAGTSPEAKKDLEKAVAKRNALLTTELSQDAINTQGQINQLYEDERKRLRDSNAAREQTISGLQDQAAATDALIGASLALTDAEKGHLERQQQAADLAQQYADDVREAQKAAQEQIEGLSTGDEFSRHKILEDLAKQIAAYDDLYAAKQKALGQSGAAAALNDFFSPMEDAYNSAAGGGIKGRLDDFFGPIEDAYDELKSQVWDMRGPSFGTFSGALADQGGGVAVQKLTDIAKYTMLQYQWSRRQAGGPTFQ